MSSNGIMIIEDVQDWRWIHQLIMTTPTEYRDYIKIYDLRLNKDRYDDILFVINKTNV